MSFLCKEKKRKMTFKYKCQASCLSTGICCDSHLVSMFCRMLSIISSTQNKCLSHLYFFLFFSMHRRFTVAAYLLFERFAWTIYLGQRENRHKLVRTLCQG